MSRRNAIAAAITALLACGHPPASVEPARSPPPAPPPPPVAPADAPAPTAGVELDVSPAEARVELDEVDRGPASGLAKVLGLEPGIHQLVISLDGYKPYRVEFTVSDKIERFTIRLDPL